MARAIYVLFSSLRVESGLEYENHPPASTIPIGAKDLESDLGLRRTRTCVLVGINNEVNRSLVLPRTRCVSSCSSGNTGPPSNSRQCCMSATGVPWESPR